MVFVLDDLVYTLTIKPWVFMMEIIYKHSLKEMYPLDKINDALKEDRLLYEFGELTTKEYNARKKGLMEKLEMAKKVSQMDLAPKLDILGIGG